MVATFSLLDSSKVTDDETVHFLRLLKLSAEKLDDTLNSYIDSLSAHYETQELMEVLSLFEVFEKIETNISSLIKTSNTTVNIDFSSFSYVKFNRSYLESIFLNLITNSIKFSSPDRAPILNIYTQIIDETQQLVFSDNGQGFDLKNVKDRIFGLHQKFTNQKNSKGIGLHLVHNQITSLGGSISVDSILDKGATFTISFRKTKF